MLATYRISSHTGFAPDTPCPSKFNSSRFDPWLAIAARLPDLIKTNAIRKALEELPVLSPDGSSPENKDNGDGLGDYDEYRLAYVLLSFFAQAYIWGNTSNNDQPSNTLPPSISVPLTQVAYDLGVIPSFVYAAGSLWLVTDDPTGPNGKRCVVSFTGTRDEEHFNLTTYAVEQAGGRALHNALLASKEVGAHTPHAQHLHNVNGANGSSNKASAGEQAKDAGKIVEALREVADALKQCKVILNSMRQGCDPDVFYNQLRPYLVGSLSVERGVRYLGTGGAEGEGIVHRFPGASAAQSPLFQSLDVLLGVKHSSGGREAFVKEMQKAMPDDHVRFIHDLSNLPSISAFVSTQPEDSEVRAVYNEAIKALGEFRSEHVRIVTSYVLQPSKKAAKSDPSSQEDAPKQGSGGSADLMGLLKGMRDDTGQSVLKAD